MVFQIRFVTFQLVVAVSEIRRGTLWKETKTKMSSHDLTGIECVISKIRCILKPVSRLFFYRHTTVSVPPCSSTSSTSGACELGKLLPVRPGIVERLPGLYTINERVVYFGKWPYGFMSFTAVGALGVGGISVPLDRTLLTNSRSDQPFRNRVRASQFAELPYREHELPSEVHVFKGQEFGRFRFGSTIVLVFEAPIDGVSWSIRTGEHVKIGQALLDIN